MVSKMGTGLHVRQIWETLDCSKSFNSDLSSGGKEVLSVKTLRSLASQRNFLLPSNTVTYIPYISARGYVPARCANKMGSVNLARMLTPTLRM